MKYHVKGISPTKSLCDLDRVPSLKYVDASEIDGLPVEEVCRACSRLAKPGVRSEIVSPQRTIGIFSNHHFEPHYELIYKLCCEANDTWDAGGWDGWKPMRVDQLREKLH